MWAANRNMVLIKVKFIKVVNFVIQNFLVIYSYLPSIATGTNVTIFHILLTTMLILINLSMYKLHKNSDCFKFTITTIRFA